MIRNFRRFTCIALALLLTAFAFAGCSAGGNDAVATDSPSSGDQVTIEGIKQKGELHVVTEVAFEPFEYYDTDGTTVIGYGKDILDYICEDLGVKLVQDDLPWQGCLPALEAKKCDFLATSVGYTKERAEKYNLTIPIAESTVVLIKRAGDDSIKDVNDMQGKIVGSQNGCSQWEALEAFNDKLKAEGGTGYAEEKLYTAFSEAYLELKNGVIDCVAQSVTNANVLIKNNPGVYEIVGEIGAKNYFSWACRKEDKELVEYLNSIIKEMKENGKLDELQEKWLGAASELPDEFVPES